jgi:hypothetical protein
VTIGGEGGEAKEPINPATAADGSRPELVDAYRFARESGISLGFMPRDVMFKPLERGAAEERKRDPQVDGE